MCANCFSTTEFVVSSAALVAVAAHRPVRRALAATGIVPEPHPRAADIRTVAFLRSLDLDPVAILGAEVTASADAATAWDPAPAYTRGRGSMRSQRRIAVQ
jgi:hypothetical protein